MSEPEEPTLATLSGLLLLADIEVGRCRDRVGWAFVGMISLIK